MAKKATKKASKKTAKKAAKKATKKVKKTVKKAQSSKPAATKASAQPSNSQSNPGMAVAIVALLLNIFILPGLGTIVGGKTKDGVIQLVVFLISIPLMLVIIGFASAFAMWIWGIVSGVKLIQAADQN